MELFNGQQQYQCESFERTSGRGGLRGAARVDMAHKRKLSILMSYIHEVCVLFFKRFLAFQVKNV